MSQVCGPDEPIIREVMAKLREMEGKLVAQQKKNALCAEILPGALKFVEAVFTKIGEFPEAAVALHPLCEDYRKWARETLSKIKSEEL